MAVAESQVAATTQSRPRGANLGMASLAGGLVLLLGMFLVFGSLPVYWSSLFPPEKLNEFLSAALLLIVGIAAIVATCYVWYSLDRAFSMPGLRAGSCLAASSIFVAIGLVFTLGGIMDKPGQEGVGIFMTLFVAVLLAVAIAFIFNLGGFGRWLVRLEDNGWFTNHAFKGSQGVRVRRATVAGLLIIGLTGIYTLVSHGTFGSTRVGEGDWSWRVPFTSQDGYYIDLPLLSRVTLLGPILLGALVFWFSWRLVNWPTFADFLIATEAEINKVSWTTRKRLFADTIVVLVTVFVLTGFLFLVDIVWFQILSNPIVNVLHVDLKREQAKQQEKTQW